MKKRILCYGDSNTWGYIPGCGGRYTEDVRWTGVMQNKLGDNYVVIEEGLNGRTTVYDDPYFDHCRNGYKYIQTCLLTHKPIDIILIMLGSNDLKTYFNADAFSIAKGTDAIINKTYQTECGRDNKKPKIILISPPNISKMREYADQFAEAEQKIKDLPYYYLKVSQKHKCYFFNATDLVNGCETDGLHLSEEGHKLLGEKVSDFILDI